MIIISFIVPVYNVENYLRECVESIIKQWSSECELILVDDGSTDNSGLLCDEYAGEQIKVIHKPNGGLSSARNAGLDMATGKYIAFVDSDDRIAMGAIPHILKILNDTSFDLSFMDAIKFYPDGYSEKLGDEMTHDMIAGKNRTEIFKELACGAKFPGSSCTKLYRTSFLKEYSIRFANDRRTSEDLWFVVECLLNAKKFESIDIPYYEYRQNRKGSITSTATDKSFDDLASFVKYYTSRFTTGKQTITPIAEYAMSFVAYEYAQLLIDYGKLKKKSQKLFLKDYKWVMKYSKSRRLKLVCFALSLCGIDNTSKLLAVYLKSRG